MIKTVYIAIGNSDDKLTQQEWAAFQVELAMYVRDYADAVHGDWVSNPTSIYQNACFCIEIDETEIDALKRALATLAGVYRQDSIAWNVCQATEFIGSSEHQ